MKNLIEENTILDFFMLDMIRNQSGKILDYGCGAGRFIKFCKARDIEIIGADTYEGIYSSWKPEFGTILQITNSAIPELDHSFQVVLSNQVFEHIPLQLVPNVCQELIRLMALGGFAIHIFPTKKTLIEPHVGIIGVHWLQRFPSIQRYYLKICCKLGFGYWRGAEKRSRTRCKSTEQCVNESLNALRNHCFFVSSQSVKDEMLRNGARVENIGYQFVAFLSPPRFEALARQIGKRQLGRWILNAIVSARLGTILKITT
jgi:SAM-dependent methyltransferase